MGVVVDKARVAAPCVLFFEELDSVANDPGEGTQFYYNEGTYNCGSGSTWSTIRSICYRL